MELIQHIKNFFPSTQLSKITDFETLELNYSSDGTLKNLTETFGWPPNLFIILYTLLDYTDKYRLLVAPQSHFKWDDKLKLEAENTAKEWNYFLEKEKLPKKSNIKIHLNNIFKSINMKKCIYDLLNQSEFCQSTFILVLSIDNVFRAKNIRRNELSDITPAEMACNMRSFMHMINSEGNLYLDLDNEGKDINLADNNTKYGFIAYKGLVPQSGLTINNLCQNLTYLKPNVAPEIIYSFDADNKFDSSSYNVLFIPWPLKVEDESFKMSGIRPIETNHFFDFFDYEPNEPVFNEVMRMLRSAIISTIKRLGSIDLIVFPECAFSTKTFNKLKEKIYEHFGEDAPSILSGVYGKDENGKGINTASLAFTGIGDGYDTIHQKKHHRWYLDRDQIRAYNLAARLDPGKKWWENIDVSRRNLAVLTTPNGIKLCPLVCEDLARQEPVAQAVRAIGPNFVVSLLLDGPQLKARWPGKYATVLSDDPGSSVLTVTPLGMTLKSTGLGDPPSRVVALWSEQGKSAEEISIGENGIGVALELKVEKTTNWSLFGTKQEKIILKKMFHSTIIDHYKDSNSNNLRTVLEKLLKDGGYKI